MKPVYKTDLQYSSAVWIAPCLKIVSPGKKRALDIKDSVRRYFRLSEAEIDSKSRQAEYVFARQVCYYLIRNHTGLTLKALGSMFGKHHTSIMSGIDCIYNYLRYNHQNASIIREVEARVITQCRTIETIGDDKNHKQ